MVTTLEGSGESGFGREGRLGTEVPRLISRPSGTCALVRTYPALKRWATIGRPYGTSYSWNYLKGAETLTPPADWPEAMVVIVGKPVSFAGDQLGSSQRVTRFIVPKAGAS
jgi:hypothetical protein